MLHFDSTHREYTDWGRAGELLALAILTTKDDNFLSDCLGKLQARMRRYVDIPLSLPNFHYATQRQRELYFYGRALSKVPDLFKTRMPYLQERCTAVETYFRARSVCENSVVAVLSLQKRSGSPFAFLGKDVTKLIAVMVWDHRTNPIDVKSRETPDAWINDQSEEIFDMDKLGI
jgi:hypothetical protein